MPSFRGELFFLSNMYPCNILNIYKSSEHLFQASLAASAEHHDAIAATADGWAAKRLARTLPRRADYREVQVSVMAHALYLKFLCNPELRAKLIAYQFEIVEENEWHDNFWGSCSCARCAGTPKANVLGKLLTITRSYFIQLQTL